ncbi:MAG: hypothetical protein JNL08_18330 [Planctomycetes bacterium]|nr:hypothetical protein [Planctomycetota bacterium]
MTADREPELGPAGVPFPGEAEWLDLPLPPADELPLRGDFVARTLRALADDRRGREADDRPDPLLTPQRLAAFAPPTPTPSFVDDTLARLRRDRTDRWRELMARHVAPEPSPEFIARTLAALAQDRAGAPVARARGRIRRFGLPLLGLAAATLVWWALGTGAPAPFEARFAGREPAAFAAAEAPSPLTSLLAAVDRDRDPDALAAGGPDVVWLAFGGGR